MYIDFDNIKTTIGSLKKELREDDNYGNHPLLTRKREDVYASGTYNGMFDLGYISGSYADNTLHGIQELIPKGYKEDYRGLLVNKDASIKFTVEYTSGYLIQNAAEDEESEIWIDFNTDVSGDAVIENELPVSGRQCEMVSFSNDIFSQELIFWLNVID